MLQAGSYIKITDNSGAKEILCINIPGRGRKKYARIGDIIVGVVKGATPEGMVKDAEKVRALIVRTKKELRRQDGTYIRFDDNAAVVLEKGKNPKGTRIFGPIAREIKEAGFGKIASLAGEVV
ncbi:MAG: 50S ribosomal protein L14 [Candidatus Cloacimonetes bacterium]|nr:50S ribosomal protein L14 [Candidatus Cloacimonadota bacterium]